jgi:hypothetical protein
MASNRVEEKKEQVAPKFEHLRGNQPSSSGGKEQPSKFVKESWYEMTTQDAQAQEASRSMFKGMYSKKGLSEMEGISFVSEGAAEQVDWRASMVANLKAKTEPPPGVGSSSLTMSEC